MKPRDDSQARETPDAPEARGRRARSRRQGMIYRRGAWWWIAYYDGAGERVFRSTKTEDRSAAERMLNEEVRRAFLIRAGGPMAEAELAIDRAKRQLRAVIDDYLDDFAGRGDAHHVEVKRGHLRRLETIIRETRGREPKLRDLDADALGTVMQRIREKGRSARTCNACRQNTIAFANWCVSRGILNETTPARLAKVKPLNEMRDRRRVRRAFTDAELARLIAVARPEGRHLWYLCAVHAGLRRGDLHRLRWGDVDLERSPMTLTVRGGKSGRVDTIPLHPELADELSAVRPLLHPARLAGALVFHKPVSDATRRRDFIAAGLGRLEPVLDANGNQVKAGPKGRRRWRFTAVGEDGKVLDLHALRTTLGTRLARAGAPLMSISEIMRHADPKTTKAAYVTLGIRDTEEAMKRLASVGVTQIAATGTDDASAATPKLAITGSAAGHAPRPSGDCLPIVTEGAHKVTTRDESGRARGRASPRLRDDEYAAESAETPRFPDASDASNRKAGEGIRTLDIQLGRLSETDTARAAEPIEFAGKTADSETAADAPSKDRVARLSLARPDAAPEPTETPADPTDAALLSAARGLPAADRLRLVAFVAVMAAMTPRARASILTLSTAAKTSTPRKPRTARPRGRKEP